MDLSFALRSTTIYQQCSDVYVHFGMSIIFQLKIQSEYQYDKATQIADIK